MTDDYKRGLVTGLALQPLMVTTETNPEYSGGGIAGIAMPAVVSNLGGCKFISFEEGS